MGWTCFYDNAGLSIDDMMRREWNATGDNGAVFSIVDSATRGSEWYAIVECKRPGNTPVYDGLVCLIKRSKRTGEFCYKDMGERCGPNAANAPKRIIDKLDKLSPIDPADDSRGANWAREWRQRCRANASAKNDKVKLSKGMIVKFHPTRESYELIESAGPRRGWYVRMVGGSGMLYRASARQLSKSIIVSEV